MAGWLPLCGDQGKPREAFLRRWHLSFSAKKESNSNIRGENVPKRGSDWGKTKGGTSLCWRQRERRKHNCQVVREAGEARSFKDEDHIGARPVSGLNFKSEEKLLARVVRSDCWSPPWYCFIHGQSWFTTIEFREMAWSRDVDTYLNMSSPSCLAWNWDQRREDIASGLRKPPTCTVPHLH